MGTHMREKVLAYWGFLTDALWLTVDEIVIIGDLNVTIEWDKGQNSLVVPSLSHWLEKIQSMKVGLHSISFYHIFPEYNSQVKLISTYVISVFLGQIHYELLDQGSVIISSAFLFT